MASGKDLADHYIEKNKRDLARLMKHCDSNGLTIVDNSILTSFVGRRLKHGLHKGMDLSNLWEVERAYNKDLLNHLDDHISFPDQTRREYAHGLRELRKRRENPLSALRFRWGMRGLEIPTDDFAYEEAQTNFGKFLEEMTTMSAALRCLTTEAHMGGVEWSRSEAYTGTFRGIADFVKEQNGEIWDKPRRHNDAGIMKRAYALANKIPTYVLTGDDHFRLMQKEFYKDEYVIAMYAGMPTSKHPMTIVLDASKRPRIQRPPKVVVDEVI